MTSAISKILKYELVPLSVLKDQVLAIDIMPILYKYLFTTNSDGSLLQNSKGELTGHLKGLLYFLKNLKKHRITPVVCLDVHPPKIKHDTIKMRTDSRLRNLEKYQNLEECKIELSSKERKAFNNLKHMIGPNQKLRALEMLKHLGVTTYRMDYIEGEKSCVGLKKAGIVDSVYSADRDLVLYETSFYNSIDFRTQTVRYYDYQKTLKELGTNAEDMTLACIATGTDYSKGIKQVGPKTVFKMLKNKVHFLQKLSEHVPNYKQILDYIHAQIILDPPFLDRGLKDPVELTRFLKDLDFNQEFVLSVLSYLF